MPAIEGLCLQQLCSESSGVINFTNLLSAMTREFRCPEPNCSKKVRGKDKLEHHVEMYHPMRLLTNQCVDLTKTRHTSQRYKNPRSSVDCTKTLQSYHNPPASLNYNILPQATPHGYGSFEQRPEDIPLYRLTGWCLITFVCNDCGRNFVRAQVWKARFPNDYSIFHTAPEQLQSEVYVIRPWCVHCESRSWIELDSSTHYALEKAVELVLADRGQSSLSHLAETPDFTHDGRFDPTLTGNSADTFTPCQARL